MKNIFKKGISAVLAAGMLVSMAGCGEKKTATDNVKLNWMVMTPEQTDSQKVWAEFNKQLQEYMPGVEVEFIPVAYSEYKQRFDLALAGGQQIDLAFGGWVVNLVNEANASSLLPLNEYLETNGKELYESMDEWLWQLTSVGDEIYAIPNNGGMGKGKFAMITHKEYADKYLDTEKVRETFWSQETFNEACYDVIEEYLEKLKANGELKKGISVTYMPGADFRGYDTVGDRLMVLKNDPEHKVEYKWSTAAARLMFQKCAEFFQKGYVREDMLSLEQPRADEGREDGYTVWFTNYSPNQEEALSKQFGYDMVAIPISEKFFISASEQATSSTVIPYTAKYPEKAVELMQLLNSEEGKGLYNLLTFGIEGEHYEKLADGKIAPFDYSVSPTADSKYGLPDYMCGNSFNAYVLKDDPENWDEMIKLEKNDNAEKSTLLGFRSNLDPIKVESAQLQAIASEYILPLSTGAIADWEAQYDQFMQKLQAAGVEKVKAEVQKQIDEFVKNR